MNRRTFLYLLLTLLAMLFLSSAAHGDSISIALTQTVQTGAPGTTLTFDATLANLTSGTVFLNGDAATTPTSSFTIDDNPFLTNAPLLLAGGASSGPFALFNVSIAPGTTPGTYSFNIFSILGGSTSADFNSLGSAQFNVNVSPVPEPGTILLLGSGLLGIGFRLRSKESARPVSLTGNRRRANLLLN
jgi:PEP-CTERM motif